MIRIENKERFVEEVAVSLLLWYDKNKRILPWRENKDPYRVWLSEIMLQQTRVEAVKPYFDRFIKELPDVSSLSMVAEDKLMKLWEGLGYYNRARNLQKAARLVMEEFDGKMPDEYELLLSLPGIGSYTAGAIASISFSRVVPAVDGNVLRILSRIYGDTSDITAPAYKKELEQCLKNVMPSDRPGDFNQAMMELGATVCVPNGQPKCEICPMQSICKTKEIGNWQEIPYKAPKKKRRIERKTILVIRNGEKLVIHKRPEKGLLAGLYEFPNVEGYKKKKEIENFVKELGFEPLHIKRVADSVHIFSHIEWHMQGFTVRIADTEFSESLNENIIAKGYELIPINEIQKTYAIPTAFKAYMPECIIECKEV